MQTLYELTGAFNKVAEMIDGEEVNPAVIDTLEALDMAIEEKADGYAKVIRNTEATSDAIDEEIKRLRARKQTLDNNVKNMKVSLQSAMEAIGKTKFKTVLFSFNVQNNPPKIELTDESAIPAEFRKVKIEYDKKAIKDALKNTHESIPGVEMTQS